MAEPHAAVTMFGVNAGLAVAGFAGGVVSLSFIRNLTKVQSALAVFTGAATAAYGTPLIGHFLTIPPDMKYSVAFFTGLCAMNLIPGVLELSRMFRRNPERFIRGGK